MSKTSNEHKTEAKKNINFSIIISSSSRYQKFRSGKTFSDPSGDLIVELVKNAGHNISSKEILPDDQVLLGKRVGSAIGSQETDAIIVSGGTGITLTDITIETLRPLMIKTLPGFGEIFRKISYDQIGSSAILTRALAGITDKGKALFCIPGSPQAVKLVMTKLILPETGHILKHAQEK
jgi:molybdenum cofactor biosynthesis protein B